MDTKIITDEEKIYGKDIYLRLVTINDCNNQYQKWLNDESVNKYLETRFAFQTIESIKDHVENMRKSKNDYLFAIIYSINEKHIGNIKLGSINPYHRYADISYFIGEKSYWGKGIAAEAIAQIVKFGFFRLSLHRIQAGLYKSNIASRKVLMKSGFIEDGIFTNQLLLNNKWEDHLYYYLLNEKIISTPTYGMIESPLERSTINTLSTNT